MCVSQIADDLVRNEIVHSHRAHLDPKYEEVLLTFLVIISLDAPTKVPQPGSGTSNHFASQVSTTPNKGADVIHTSSRFLVTIWNRILYSLSLNHFHGCIWPSFV